MIWKATLVLSLAICVLSYKRPAISEQKIELFSGHHGQLEHIGQHEPEHHEIYAWAYPSYEFSYHVNDPHTHDMKGQHEVRDGDKVTGNYWLIQPDGLKRIVKYRSDHKNGFQAEVHYQPHDGQHYEVKEYNEEKYDNNKRIGINERQDGGYDWRSYDNDAKRGPIDKLDLDDKRNYDNSDDKWDRDDRRGHDNRDNKWDHGDRHGHDNRDDKWNRDERRGQDIKKGHDAKWGYDDKNDHNERQSDKNDRKNYFSAWIKHGKENRDNYREGRKNNISGKRLRNDNEEHWKHGVLVGWREGRDRDYRDEGRDKNRRDDKRNDESNYGRRDRYSYDAPLKHFKPLIPYGQRLDY